MPLRRFHDPGGMLWQVWDVSPTFTPARSGTERRRGTVRFTGSHDRRASSDRRAQQPAPWAKGWLCFECTSETRRLMPIPDQWESCSTDELEIYRQRALVSRKPRV